MSAVDVEDLMGCDEDDGRDSISCDDAGDDLRSPKGGLLTFYVSFLFFSCLGLYSHSGILLLLLLLGGYTAL